MINRIKLTLFVFSVSALLFSCMGSRGINKSGEVIFKTLPYNRDLGKFTENDAYWPDLKMLYKDSTVIFKVMGTQLPNQVNGEEVGVAEAVVMFYLYASLKKMVFYKYGSFSDTAKILQSYNEKQSDTVFYGVPWKFFLNESVFPHTKPYEIIADTVINGRNFKRVRIENFVAGEADATVTIAHFDCSRKGTIFEINKELSDLVGCPLVEHYQAISVARPTTLLGRLDFISDKLTKEELKVFAAWKKNIKKYPVKD